jgi:hypothetical protein
VSPALSTFTGLGVTDPDIASKKLRAPKTGPF